MIVTGFALFWPTRHFLLTRPQFYVKMAFVVTLLANSFVIGKLKDTSTTRPCASLSTREKIPLFISGAVSTVSWLMATAAAFFLFPD